MKKFLALLVACSTLLASCTPKETAVAKRISQSTVLVHIYLSKGEKHGEALCSGVVVSKHEILLADHCVNPPQGIKVDKVWIKDYQGRSQEAKIESKDGVDDLALLEIRKPEIPIKISKHQPQVGETIWVVGMPLGIEWSVSKGIVARNDIRAFGFLAKFFIITAIVLPGNSGGGIFNEKGELCGIVSMSTSMIGNLGASGLGIGVSLENLRDFLGI